MNPFFILERDNETAISLFINTWCRIASNWHHKNEGGEGGVVPNSFNLAPHKFCGGEVTGGSGGEVGGSGGQYPPAASSPNRGE